MITANITSSPFPQKRSETIFQIRSGGLNVLALGHYGGKRKKKRRAEI
jgi:hypothetical protein